MKEVTKKKKYVFEHYEKYYADFRIRLKYDNLKQAEFFSLIMEGYIGKDPYILKAVENYKLLHRKMGREALNRVSKAYKESSDLFKALGITKEDKETIFDLIESSSKDS